MPVLSFLYVHKKIRCMFHALDFWYIVLANIFFTHQHMHLY